MEARARELFGASIDLSVYSPVGALVQLMAWNLSQSWELAEKVYYSLYIDTADGVHLDRLVRIGSLSRLPAQRSTVTVTFTGTNDTIIPAGYIIETPQGVKFQTSESGTISGGSIDLACISVSAGANSAVPSNSITEIITPIEGLSSITNASASTGAADIEQDHQLRLRYKEGGGSGGGSSVFALRRALQNQIPDINQIRIFENASKVTDSESRPPNSIEVVALSGLSSEIARVIFENKPAGIETVGNIEQTVISEDGQAFTVKFSRPTSVDIFLIVNVTSNAAWQNGQEDEVREAIIKYIGGVYSGTIAGEPVSIAYNGLGIGEDVLFWKLVSSLDDVVGIEDVEILLGKTDPPTLSNNIDILGAEIARTENANIEVNVT